MQTCNPTGGLQIFGNEDLGLVVNNGPYVQVQKTIYLIHSWCSYETETDTFHPAGHGGTGLIPAPPPWVKIPPALRVGGRMGGTSKAGYRWGQAHAPCSSWGSIYLPLVTISCSGLPPSPLTALDFQVSLSFPA